MKEEITAQRQYWNREADAFDAIYSRKKSKFAVWLDRTFRRDMYERFDYTIQHCSPIPGRRFLDVGCGSGVYAVELARQGAGSVVGVDIAENMITLSQEYARKKNVADKCVFVLTDLPNYSPETPFDVSFGIGLFDYVREPLPLLVRMREVSTDKAIASFPRLWTWRAIIRKIRLTIRGCDVYFYSRNRVELLLKEAGFKSWSIESVGKLFCVTARIS
jgi:cyclopropane fatty-acyl-phospholipid synthase-like methyltransferase